jgi:hypothetical protein
VIAIGSPTTTCAGSTAVTLGGPGGDRHPKLTESTTFRSPFSPTNSRTFLAERQGDRGLPAQDVARREDHVDRVLGLTPFTFTATYAISTGALPSIVRVGDSTSSGLPPFVVTTKPPAATSRPSPR